MRDCVAEARLILAARAVFSEVEPGEELTDEEGERFMDLYEDAAEAVVGLERALMGRRARMRRIGERAGA